MHVPTNVGLSTSFTETILCGFHCQNWAHRTPYSDPYGQTTICLSWLTSVSVAADCSSTLDRSLCSLRTGNFSRVCVTRFQWVSVQLSGGSSELLRMRVFLHQLVTEVLGEVLPSPAATQKTWRVVLWARRGSSSSTNHLGQVHWAEMPSRESLKELDFHRGSWCLGEGPEACSLGKFWRLHMQSVKSGDTCA